MYWLPFGKGKGEWNTYDVIAVDGIIKLAVNGKFVNGISRTTQKKGCICMESEGAKIYFRNIRIMELPSGVTSSEQTAPETDSPQRSVPLAAAHSKNGNNFRSSASVGRRPYSQTSNAST
jgi:hypothetical protein